MKTDQINLVYFSATHTTKRVIKAVGQQFGGNISEYDITQTIPTSDIILGREDLLIVGVPSYGGRIAAVSLPALQRFKGNGTPAIIVCVYGNREYDDALLELKDIVEGNGFKVVSAGAFIAQHSIFPAVAKSRPDEKDMEQIREFANASAHLLESVEDISVLPEISVKGKRPYKSAGSIPMKPKGDSKCNECGTCVKQCPVGAISADAPQKTDKKKCISCGRCITVCPQKSRHFGGLMYKIAGGMFRKAFSARKEPEVVYGLQV